MKSTLLTLIIALSLNSQAKLNDFNTLITENSKAQNELHSDLAQKLNETRVAVNLEKRDRFLVDSSATINVPTTKGVLTYSKEKNYYRVSDKKIQKRLAQELDSAN